MKFEKENQNQDQDKEDDLKDDKNDDYSDDGDDDGDDAKEDLKDELIKEFLNWCQTNKISFDSSFLIYKCKSNSSFSLKNFKNNPSKYNLTIKLDHSNHFISTKSIVAAIPKSICFSHQSSSWNKYLQIHQIHTINNPILRLTSHLTHELHLGSSSFWSPYLNLLTKNSNLPQFAHWIAHHHPQINQWLNGTEIIRLIQNHQILSLPQLKFYHHQFHSKFNHSWKTFKIAYKIVSSRAFYIDNFHNLALVPFADLFDHSDEPDIQMVSDDIVCSHCGSLTQCSHDDDHLDQNQNQFNSIKSNLNLNDTVELECIQPLISSQDLDDHQNLKTIFNNYGNLPNARLLTEYGFLIDTNLHDKIYFDLNQLINQSSFLKLQRFISNLSTLFENDNEIVYRLDNTIKDLSIDSAAKLSPLLWLTVAYQTGDGLEDLLAIEPLTQLLSFQISLIESHEQKIQLIGISQPVIDQSLKMAKLLQKICQARLSQYHLHQKTSEELLDLKETLLLKNSNSPKIQNLALLIDYSISERILIQTCHTKWHDIEKLLTL